MLIVVVFLNITDFITENGRIHYYCLIHTVVISMERGGGGVLAYKNGLKIWINQHNITSVNLSSKFQCQNIDKRKW